MAKKKKDERYIARGKEATKALDEIREKYENLKYEDIESFMPVYYPIAILQMKLEETTFEDFEIVQYVILSLVNSKILDSNVIAETLGLSKMYIKQILELLRGYGYIDTSGITKMGQRSLNEGKKIKKVNINQKFQIDALNGDLLKIDQVVEDDKLYDKAYTKWKIGHVKQLNQVSVEYINQQIEDNAKAYIKNESSVLNANVTSIQEIICTELKYARSYMMKIIEYDEPIVFAKRYNTVQTNVRNRFSWTPFSMPEGMDQEGFGFEDDVPHHSDLAEYYLSELYNGILERAEKAELKDEDIEKGITGIYPFSAEGYEIQRNSDIWSPSVKINKQAFTKYDSWIIRFLASIQQEECYLLTNENMDGRLISLETDDNTIIETAELLQSKILIHGRPAVTKRIRETCAYYGKDHDENIIDFINKELKKI